MFKKIEPSVYQDQKTRNDWVKISELSEVLGRSPREIYRSFRALSDQFESIDWLNEEGQYHSNRFTGGWRSPTENPEFHTGKEIYFPYPWWRSIQGVIALGGYTVQLVRHSHLHKGEEECPAGTWRCWPSHGGYHHGGVVRDKSGDIVPMEYNWDPKTGRRKISPVVIEIKPLPSRRRRK